MKRTHRRSAIVAVLVPLALAASARSQQPGAATEEHKALAADVGEWDADVSLWIAADAQPMQSKAVETNKMLGDKWLLSEFKGEIAGQKFEGHSQMGYDPQKKKYIGTWIDTISPFLQTMEGDFDKSTNTATMMASGVDLHTGKPSTSKMVTRYEGDDAKTFEIHMPVEGQDGKWWKTMEIKYKRRK